MKATQILLIAAKHLNNGAAMASSATLCFTDALNLLHTQDDLAQAWALRSLAYSVGIFHPDYQKVAAYIKLL